MIAAEVKVLSVSELNRSAGRLLEHSFRNIWVRGEVSDLSHPSSGHLYFVLKDEQARIRCALFRNRQQRLVAELKNGSDILVRGTVGIYPVRGDYQLIVDYLELGGEGRLRREFEQLKQKLADEGLFESHRKRPLASAPSRVGLITSASGAALRDLLATFRRRCPLLAVVLYPAVVQGAEAAPALIRSLLLANAHHACTVLIVARGGGSMEDLQAFNTEAVARAIAASEIPVITGIGHETDFTIADFVADYRAATPTAAAERASPDSHHWSEQLLSLRSQLQRAMENKIDISWQQLDRNQLRLKDPLTRINLAQQKLLLRYQQLEQLGLAVPKERRTIMTSLLQRLYARQPDRNCQQTRMQLDYLRTRLLACAQGRIAASQQVLQAQKQELYAVSPEATLERGYAIVRRQSDRSLITTPKGLVTGELLETQVRDGKIISSVQR